MKNNYSLKPKPFGFQRWFFFATCMVVCLFTTNTQAQFAVTTNSGSGLAPTYTSLGAAVTALNAATITSPVVITCPAGTETSPAGGYSITAQGTSVNTITITGAGATSIITAPTPAGTAGALNDAIFKLVGADFITIQGFAMNENALNLTTAATTNNMVEFGVALLYASATNGCQNITIQNNTITLNRVYQNTFGIYANSTHTATAVTTSATATGATGGNHNLKVYGNTISNVNNGIVVIGPTAAADQNNVLDIGGTGGIQANSITNYGTTGTFSGYANVSGTVNGVLVRNATSVNISYNTIASSNGGVTVGTLNGIQLPAASVTPTNTFTNNINFNNISLRIGLTTGAMVGLSYPSGSGSATSTLNVLNNDFNTFGHTVAGSSGSITCITVSCAHQFTTISNNTFTNLSVNTTGGLTLIAQSSTAPANGTKTTNNNSIVTGLSKTGAGGTVTFITDNGSTVSGAVSNCQNNNFSNVTLTGATGITGISFTDGGTAPAKNITGNTLNNWTTGAGAINAINVTYLNGVSSISSNTITNITGQSTVTGITLGAVINTATSVSISSNTITNLTSTGTGGSVNGITCSNTSTGIVFNNNSIRTLASSAASSVSGIVISAASSTSITKNTICDISGSNAGSTVNGILVSAGTTVSLSNNRVGDLRTPIANASNPLVGINITGGTTVNCYYNTVSLAALSSGALFGSSAISASTTPALTLNNNIFVNTSIPNGAGLTVAYRRSSTTLTTYTATSDKNDFFASTIFTDGTNTFAAFGPGAGSYKNFVTTRDAFSISENPPFLSTTCGNANFLKVNTAVATGVESGAINIAGITDDFENQVRQGNGGYAGTGTAPDMGADEFNGIPLPICQGTPAASTINGAAAVCTGFGTTLTLSTTYTDIGINYQWQSSTTAGGPYSPMGTSSSQATGNLSVNTYYICVINCTNSGQSFTTVEKSVLVNPLPTVTLSPSTGSFCTPGGSAVTLTAGGASTYAYSPTSGLTPTSGSPVAASPSGTTTYTVTGTDGNGCIATATSVISVARTPVSVSATATPSSICPNATSNLTSSAFVQNTASLPNSYAFNGSTSAYSSLSGATVLGAGVIGDDVGIGNLPIGFTFNYNNIAQTVFGVSSNGMIQLGNTSATFTGFSGNALATTANIIAAFWDDNNTTGSTVQYQTSGSVGNRVLTVEWIGLKIGGSGSGTNTLTMQMSLFEATGAIQMKYGSSAIVSGAITASIGISGASGNFRSVTPLSPASSSTSSTVTENTGISAFTNIPSGTTYTFTPPSIALSYAWSPATDVVSPASQNTATNSLAATTVFTVTATNSGCSATASTTVTINPLVGLAATASSPRCAGSNFTVTANITGGGAPFSYVWSDGVGGVYPNSPTITANLPAGTYNFSCSISDACGSSAVSALSGIVVNALPAVSASPSTGAICLPGGSPVTITAGGASTYSWSPTSGLTPTSGSPVSANPSATTTYTVTGTAANGCVATATSVISVLSYPVGVTASASPSTICVNTQSNLSATGVVPVPASQYAFAYDPNNGGIYPLGAPTTIVVSGVDDAPMGATAGTSTAGPSVPIGFTFNFEGTNYSHFSASPDGWITLKNSTAVASSSFTNTMNLSTNVPKISAYWDDVATGLDGSVQMEVLGSAPSRILVVQWFVTIPRATAGAANSTFQTWLYEGSGIVEFHYGTMGTATGTVSSGLTGATSSNLNSITFSTNTASTTANNTQVPGALPAANTLYSFTPPAATYSWAPAADVQSPNSSITTTNPLPATEIFTVTVSNGGCNVTASTTVTINALSSQPATASTPNCAGSNFTVTANTTGGGAPYNYNWSDGVNPPGFYPNAPTITANLPSGTYTFSCSISDACGSTVISTVQVVVNALPTVTAAPSTASICNPGGSPITITAGGATTYAWSPVAGLTPSTGSPVSANPSATTTYTVTGTDANGCTNTASAVVNVGLQPSVSIQASPSPVCPGGNSSLLANVQYPTSAYCTTSQTTGTCAGGDEFISNVNFNTINNSSTCAQSLPSGYTNYTSISTTLSPGSYPLTFTNGGPFSGDQGRVWIDFNQNGSFTDPGEEFTTTNSLNTTFTASITVPPGAFNGATRMRVRLTYTGSILSCGSSSYGETEDYTVNISGGVDTYTLLWSETPGTTLTSTTSNPTTAQNIATASTYTVNVTSSAGCTASSSVTVSVSQVDDNNACTTDACDPLTGAVTHSPVNTDDNNVCTTDGCDPVTGVFHNPVNTDDNNVCTTDGCDPVTGVFHNPVNTDDGNACTTDGCDPVTGVFHNPVNTDDNNVCTTDGCDPITGVFHNPVNTDDGNPCTDDACDPVSGQITHTPVNVDDNNVCTTDGCDPVTGVYHTLINTDDNNPCTTDGCDPVTGVFHNPVNTDDNNVCTTDGCDPITGVFHNPVNTDDNNVCTTDGCDPVTGVYHTPISTDDNNACTTDGCDPVTGIFHTPVNTDDNNVCTTDGCDPVTGVYHTPISTDDNNACTTDGCDPVTGVFHTPVNTDDNNVCTTDGCDPVTGVYHTPISTDDNNACTTDGCNPVTGIFHNSVNINDNNVCTIDACNTTTGAITHTAVADGSPGQDDGNACTLDVCVAGNTTHTPVTIIGSAVIAKWTFDGITVAASGSQTPSITAGSSVADVGNQTTGSAFSAFHNSTSTAWTTVTGNGSVKSISSNNWQVGDFYQFAANTASFTNIKVTFDQTGSSTGPRDFKLQYSLNGTSFTDVSAYAVLLNGAPNGSWTAGTTNLAYRYTYDLSAITSLNSTIAYFRLRDNSTTAIGGSTVATGGTSRVDNFTISGTLTQNIDDNNVCTADACDPLTGISHTPISVDDNNLCTTDACDPITGPSHTPISVDDNNLCTTDGCDPVTGVYHTPVSTDDNNVCTTDGCDPVSGVFHNLINTDDNNVCTTDGCHPVTGVFHNPVNTDDGNACTTDACDPQTQTITHTPVNTDDNNICTTDGCDPVTGIFHNPVNTDDGNPCTTDACDPVAQTITHTPVNTDDNNVCTTDGCDPVTGVFHTPVSTDDNNACTTDGCDPVTGVFHTAVNTDDNNVCTTDGCDPVTGVFHNPVVTNDGNPCTDDACNPITGIITHTPINTDDNNVCTTDGCDPVTGVFHNPVSTDDNNVCTTDGCDPITGVFHTLVNTDDGNVCTTDGCDPVTGVYHTPVNTDDGNVCTTDGCDPVTDIFHTPVNTNDGNACTTDGCDPITGIFHTFVSTDDGNACTTDACNPATGAITHTSVPNGSPGNDDGNACTLDVCINGNTVHTPVTITGSAVIAKWTFEGITVASGGSQTPSITVGSPIADVGNQTAGSAFSAFHTSTSTAWTTPSGNASPKSLSSNNWQIGDYYQFVVNTTSFTNIIVTFDQAGSNTGPRDFKLQYSLNGTSFTDVLPVYTVLLSSWTSSGTVNLTFRYTYNLSAVTSLNSNFVYFRLRDNSTSAINNTGSVAAAGTGRVDNFTVNGNLTQSINDNNVCTIDGCDPVTGVFHSPVNTDDGNACTTDGCDPVTGIFHNPVNTNDNNVCTTDGCNPVTGVYHTPVNTDDGDACTSDGCDPVSGVYHTPVSTDDGNTCTSDGCDPAIGVYHTPVNTDDNNVCTTDGCDPATGVFHNPVNTDDNNVCTTDGCDPVTGVFHNPLNTDDGDACTTDGCDPVTGLFHTPVNTDDGDACTTDGCNPATGVYHTPVNTDDNNVCTTDGCDQLTGVFHNPVNIDDNNVCTTDGCDPVTGVFHNPVSTDDGNACTTDGCDPVTGVYHNPIPCGITLNATMYLEGYYAASNTGLMDNYGSGGCLFLNGSSTNPLDADSVEISLMDASTYAPVDVQKGILKVNGTISVTFSSGSIGTSYYLRVKHRSAVQTWSANPVLAAAVTSYDFSTAQTQAYGSNMVLTGDGLHWAFYSGDISDAGSALIGIQDEVIESQDYSDMENAVFITLSGYVTEDITGDLVVESLDYSIMENNVFFVIQSLHP